MTICASDAPIEKQTGVVNDRRINISTTAR